jgi:MerR family transcriptional regulator, thiopeptide resistance regulator
MMVGMKTDRMYTVKQLAGLAGVSTRALHYYDEIGLLSPDAYGENGYRYYGDQAVLKLQQILFFKELGFSLDEVQKVIGRPDFDVLQALGLHKEALQKRAQRLDQLILTVDKTMQYMKGKSEMKQKEFFQGFSEEKQKKYEEEIRQRYGEKAFEGTIDWNSYTAEQKSKIIAESNTIYTDLVAVMDKGHESPEVQKIIVRWHQHLRYFYEPSIERLQGLGQLYNDHPDFRANFTKIHPDLPMFMKKAIDYYCEQLIAGQKAKK